MNEIKVILTKNTVIEIIRKFWLLIYQLINLVQFFLSVCHKKLYSIFRGSTYNLINHNCNNFSNDLAQFLCGATIPTYILDLPNEVLSTKLSSILLNWVTQLESSARPIAEEQSNTSRDKSPDLEQLNSQIEEARSEINGDSKVKKQ